MQLRTISLAGFKSFADRTRLVCEPGVTVVVGPNGSGKSNLVDAMAWVMGTQATTSLRTQRMEDVIFAGTSVRPALGRAEVAVTFDAEGTALPFDASEVTISRRLFRDGTSEYAINGTPCRLLDIQELLADSGVGRHQHVIVGQGRVDAVLNADVEEHRAVIEEAAGVIKHRRRRDRSIRRLEATDADVERLQDLLTEQQRRMRPLKRQARAAERHDEMKERWRAARLWLGGEQLREARSRRSTAEADHAAAGERLDAAVAERAAIDEALGGLQAAAGDTGAALERDTLAAARLETAAERLHRIALVARERRLGLEQRHDGATARRDDLERELGDLTTQIESSIEEEATARSLAERHEIELRALTDEERSLAEQDQLPVGGMVAAVRGDLAALEAASVRDQRETDDLDQRRDMVRSRLEAEQGEAAALDAEIEAARSDVEEADRALAEATARWEEDRRSHAAADAAARDADLAVAAAAARIEALQAAAAGLADPEARRRVEALEVVAGPVTARLDVPAAMAAAVDAALGPWADAVVARDPDGAMAAVSALKSDGSGGMAVVAAGEATGSTAQEVAASMGVVALVDELGTGADRALAERLLGDVMLVEGWRAAWNVVRRHPHLRAVTPEGDLVTATGVVAAHPDGAGPAAIEAARVAEERAATEAARASSLRNAAHRALEGSENAAALADDRRREVTARLAGMVEARGLLERSEAEHEAELGRIEGRLGAIADGVRARAERITGLRTRLADLEGEDADGQAAWEATARRRTEVATARDEARRRREASTAELAAVVERRRLYETRRSEVEELLADTGEGEVDGTHLDRLTTTETAARRAVELVRARVDELRERQRSLRTEAGDAGDRLEEARQRRDDLGREIEEVRDVQSRTSVELAELAVREESAAEGLRRDVDASEEDALAAARPELPDDVDPAAHVDDLGAQLRRLGPVNPLAAAEYRELAERAEFMEEQLADLDESRAELRKVISALDDEIARLFVEAFDEIAVMFSENFSLLFPGGTGVLTLTDPDDPLTTGVEINAQPMGKKVGQLALLSGGERSLAALAFLFAVFRARPSPFYVLDEVEAALDDANLRRFLRLIDTMRDTAQLVIVTHQQQTMEAADLLYGVTMEPGQSSQVLAKRLTTV